MLRRRTYSALMLILVSSSAYADDWDAPVDGGKWRSPQVLDTTLEAVSDARAAQRDLFADVGPDGNRYQP